MSRKTDDVNLLLRNYVQRTGFDLTLGHTHIACLIGLDIATDNKSSTYPAFAGRDVWASAVHGLIRRGLVKHHEFAKSKPWGEPISTFYTITRAGELVLGLLRESGIYREYTSAAVVKRESA